ncbi:MAG: hypothetical protein ACO1O1_14685 [Adhaeribacter sp.]
MKKSFFPLVLAGFIFLVSLASCSSSAVVRYPYPAQSSTRGLPPGQAKKVYGHQSAKAFAPGQQKKSSYHPSSQQNGHSHKKGKKKK